VYLTTTSGNKAMTAHAAPGDFTRVSNGNQHWDTDYVWEIPFVPMYTQGDRNLCQDLCFLQWDIKIEKSKFLHCKKASSNTDMGLLQCVKNKTN